MFALSNEIKTMTLKIKATKKHANNANISLNWSDAEGHSDVTKIKKIVIFHLG